MSRTYKFSSAQKRAYWIGVGISAERHGDSDKILLGSNVSIRNSAIAGYNADNKKDLSSRVGKGACYGCKKSKSV